MATRREQRWRPLAGVVSGAAVAAAGALLLGEYNFSGWPIFAGCVLLGLFVSEAVASAGGRRGLGAGLTSAVLAAAGLTWSAWISSGRDLSQLPSDGWIAVGLGALAAGLMATSPWRAGGNRPAPSETD
jgi:ABC-type cobalamin transport system permease subunit